MPWTNAAGQAFLEHYFQNTNHANVGDATGLVASTSAGSFYISLHTADPGLTGNQTTNEAAYTGYARVAVARTSGGFTVSTKNCSNTAAVTFGTCTAGSSTVTHFGIGTDSTGTGNLLWSDALDASLAISTSANQTPEFAIGALDVDA